MRAGGHTVVLVTGGSDAADDDAAATAAATNGPATGTNDLPGPRRVLEAALDEVLGETHAEAAEIFLRDPNGERMFLAAFRGLFPHAFKEITLFQEGSGFPGTVLRLGRPLLVSALDREERYLRRRVTAKGFRFYLCAPVPATDGIVGSLHIAARHDPQTVLPQLPTLERVAMHLGMTLELERMRGRGAIAAYRVDPHVDAGANLERALDHALQVVMRMGEGDTGAIVLCGRDAPRLTYGLGGRWSCQLTTERARSGGGLPRCPVLTSGRWQLWPAAPAAEPAQCRRPAALHAAMCLPLETGARTLGVLCVGYSQRRLVPGHALGSLPSLADEAARTIDTLTALVRREAAVRSEERRRLMVAVDAALHRGWTTAELHGRLTADAGGGQGVAADGYVGALHSLLRGEVTAISGVPKSTGTRSTVASDGVAPLADAAPAFIDFRCLGPFSALRDGVPLSPERFVRRRALTVLKILLTRYGKVVFRDELLEWLWPEGPPRDANALVQVAVHNLRRGLEPRAGRGRPCYILTEGDGYAFDVASPHRFDARELIEGVGYGLRLEEERQPAGALAAYRAAAALYAGDYLEDEPYSDWCREKREEVRQAFLTLQRRMVRLLRAEGNVDEAVECCRRVLSLDGSLEDVHRELMQALWETGRRAEALRQYEVCRQVLRRELGVEPTAETESLYRQVLAEA